MKPAALLALGLALLASTTSLAQRKPAPPTGRSAGPGAAPAKRERAVPFQVGETLTYDVSWSTYVVAGTAVTTVKEKKASYDSTAYYLVAEARPTPLVSRLYSLYYKLDSLLDVYSLLPQRGSVYTEEGKRHRVKTTRFDRGARKAFFEYQSTTTAKSEFPIAAFTQDALSAVYVMRAIPLKPGDHMTMPVSDDGLNYQLTIDVGGSERVRTPLGEFEASKVMPAVADDKGRAVGRNLAVWISNDTHRYPLKIQAELAVGSFVLLLRDAR